MRAEAQDDGSDRAFPDAVRQRQYHRAVELIGKRWTGAILFVLMDGPLRFSEVKQLVPELSDRLLSERMKELERCGIVQRRQTSAPVSA